MYFRLCGEERRQKNNKTNNNGNNNNNDNKNSKEEDNPRPEIRLRSPANLDTLYEKISESY